MVLTQVQVIGTSVVAPVAQNASAQAALVVSVSVVAAKLTGEWWIPLRLLGSRMDMFSVIDVVIGFFLFFPLGAALAVWPLRPRSALAGFLPALYLAAVLEVGQTFVAGRTMDMTDFLVQAAGAVVGWTIVRRAGYRPYGSVLVEKSVLK